MAVTIFPDRAVDLCASGLLLLLSALALGAPGPPLLAAAASAVLVWRSLGFRFSVGEAMPLGRECWSRLGPLVVVHSHHAGNERRAHEFRVAGKYVCAGCVGVAAGTVAGLTVAGAVHAGVLDSPGGLTVTVIVVCCALPALALLCADGVCTPALRGAAYALVPFGAWLGLAALHEAARNPWLNVGAIAVIAAGWHVGGVVYRRNRKRRG